MTHPLPPTIADVLRTHHRRRIARWLLYLTAATGAGWLVGCGPRTPPEGVGVEQVGSGVTVLTLKDGTRCAVYNGYKAGGIDCDWRRP